MHLGGGGPRTHTPEGYSGVRCAAVAPRTASGSGTAAQQCGCLPHLLLVVLGAGIEGVYQVRELHAVTDEKHLEWGGEGERRA